MWHFIRWYRNPARNALPVFKLQLYPPIVRLPVEFRQHSVIVRWKKGVHPTSPRIRRPRRGWIVLQRFSTKKSCRRLDPSPPPPWPQLLRMKRNSSRLRQTGVHSHGPSSSIVEKAFVCSLAGSHSWPGSPGEIQNANEAEDLAFGERIACKGIT